MTSILLIAVPLTTGVISFFIRHDHMRRGMILACSVFHILLTCLMWTRPGYPPANAWFGLDSLSIIFLSITSILFAGASVYAVKYLSDEKQHFKDINSHSLFFSVEAVFTGCLLLFLSAMTTVIVSRHLAVLWVAVEATTLASAPLIYFHRTKYSLEATWKYLLICSVGIALALLGVFFLAAAGPEHQGDMLLPNMIKNAGQMNVPWLKAAFLFLFAGYGTKMGLAPFHTWLPDAHSEAPSVISALLSGALLNCAFLGIMRGYQICIAAGLMPFCREIFIVFGLISVIFAAIFILGQADFKRMLAYSSVEHMGILTLGLGLGGSAVSGAMMNMFGHSLTKAGLFFAAGNIYSFYRTKTVAGVRGILNGTNFRTGILWMTGFLLITGTPPSSIFLGKFMILKEALLHEHYIITFVFLSALAVVFIGMSKIFISMAQGLPHYEKFPDKSAIRDSLWTILPSALFFILVVLTGMYLPDWMSQALTAAAREIGGY